MPLAEHDRYETNIPAKYTGFNSRAPRGARRLPRSRSALSSRFQFTCPSRSTTRQAVAQQSGECVSIHVPLAEHDLGYPTITQNGIVSIHVPLAEHDLPAVKRSGFVRVSIHVPLAEHDSRCRRCVLGFCGFNSRAPRGARPCCPKTSGNIVPFQFTCPSRSTTFQRYALGNRRNVSIHVPLAEHDLILLKFRNILIVSIHVPLAEHDAISFQLLVSMDCFNSRAPRGARRFRE